MKEGRLILGRLVVTLTPAPLKVRRLAWPPSYCVMGTRSVSLTLTASKCFRAWPVSFTSAPSLVARRNSPSPSGDWGEGVGG